MLSWSLQLRTSLSALPEATRRPRAASKGKPLGLARDVAAFILVLVIWVLFFPLQLPSVTPCHCWPSTSFFSVLHWDPFLHNKPVALSNTISDVVALNGTKGGSTELGKGRRRFRCMKNGEYGILIGGPNNTMPSIYVVVLGHIGHMTSSHLESPENTDMPTVWIKPGGLREVK